ncbi:hypothetical protein CCH79_00002571, partial [Gambusia affinis]
CAYVVRKIRASVSEGEQEEKPIRTPCSAKAESKSGRRSKSSSTAALNPGHDEGVDGAAAAAAGTSSGAPVQNCGS